MLKKILSYRYVSHAYNNRCYAGTRNPFKRTLDAISVDLRFGFSKENPPVVYPEHTDVLIIGGGFIGSSAAYWLKQRAGNGLSVVVIDKDLTYKGIPQNISQGVLSQHFSLSENILLSQFSSEFLRNAKRNLNKDVDIQFHPHGYLVLACEKYAEQLEKNVSFQREFGVKNELLTTDQIKKRYPWINTSDVKLGCLSLENEGTFNAKNLLNGFINRSLDTGAQYIEGNVVGFTTEHQRGVLMEGVNTMTWQKLTKVNYKTKNDEERSVSFALCILAAGAESSNIAKYANIGIEKELLSVPLPIEKREFDVYTLVSDIEEDKPGLNSPIIMDTSGLWLQRNGIENNMTCGQLPLMNSESNLQNTDTELVFKPSLQNRFPTLSNGKLEKLRKEEYDCNTFDDSGILGQHPYYSNLIFATGFGRLGVPHSPGIGRAVSDIIIDSNFTSTDLTGFSFDRLLLKEPFVEFSIY